MRNSSPVSRCQFEVVNHQPDPVDHNDIAFGVTALRLPVKNMNRSICKFSRSVSIYAYQPIR